MEHFLQSAAWEAFQKSLGRKTISESGTDWSYLAVVEKGMGNSRLYAPYGPEARYEKALREAIISLKNQALRENATFLRIEPTHASPTLLKKLGFKPVTYQQLNPARTQIITLGVDKDELLAQMSQNSRNLTRNYSNKGIVIKHSQNPEDITILTTLMRGVAKRNGITPHAESYFKKQAETLFPLEAASLYYASFENKPIAAALIYDSDTTRYYAHAAADDTYRNLSAGTALLGQMILDAKDKGLSYVDLYGIAPDNQPNHPWNGFTKFKRSFGGQPVDFAGAWDLPLKPFRYWLYRVYQTLRRIVR